MRLLKENLKFWLNDKVFIIDRKSIEIPCPACGAHKYQGIQRWYVLSGVVRQIIFIEGVTQVQVKTIRGLRETTKTYIYTSEELANKACARFNAALIGREKEEAK